jgi:hypothetical protein
MTYRLNYSKIFKLRERGIEMIEDPHRWPPDHDDLATNDLYSRAKQTKLTRQKPVRHVTISYDVVNHVNSV